MNDPPLALLLDMFLSRYGGYTAEAVLEEDFHIVQALLEICAACNEAARQI